MKIFLLIQRKDGSIEKVPLEDGARYQARPGENLTLVDEQGNPVELPMERLGGDLIVRLSLGEEATIEGFFAGGGDGDAAGGQAGVFEQVDPVEVSLGGDGSDQGGSGSNIGQAATEPDDAFSLMRYSDTDYIGFEGGSDGIDPNLFSTGFVGGVNSDAPPNISPDRGEIESGEDSSVRINLLQNDSDPEGGTLTVSSINGIGVSPGQKISLPSGAEVTFLGGGEIEYVPGEDFNYLGEGETAIDTFEYSAKDPAGNEASSKVSVTVNGANDPPTANDDDESGEEGKPISIDALANDVDPDRSDTLTVISVDDPPQGGITHTPEGTVTYDPGDHFDYLSVGESETVTVGYTVSDEHGATSTSELTFTIIGVNDPPEAIDDTVNVTEDIPVTIDALANDSDPENDKLDITEINGSRVAPGVPVTLATGARVTLQPDGTLSYDPNDQFEDLGAGETALDSFTYSIDDGNGGTAQATVSVRIDGVNDGPTIDTNTLSITEGQTVPISHSEINATDPDHGSADLTFTVNNPQGGRFLLNGNPTTTFTQKDIDDGLVQFEDDGSETPPSYTLTVADPGNLQDQSPLVLNYNPVNDSPVAVDDVVVGHEDGPVNISVLVNDSDPENQSLSVTRIGNNLVATGVPTTIGSGARVTLQPDGTVDYDPNGQFDYLGGSETAIDTFSYEISDGAGGTSVATVSVTVNGTNDTPEAIDDSFSVAEDGTISYDLRVNDTDPDSDPLFVVRIEGSNLSPGDSTTLASGAIVTLNPDGTVQYDPDDQFELPVGATAVDSFTYRVSDGNGGFDTATATVTIDGVNDAPIAQNDFSLGNTPGRPVTFDVLANDSDVDGSLDPLTVAIIDPNTSNPTNQLVVPNEGVWSVDTQERVTFTPDPNLQGQPTPVEYTVQDNDGAPAAATGTLTTTYANLDLWFGNDLSGSVDSTEFAQSRALISGMADLMPFSEGNGVKAALYSWAETNSAVMNQSITADSDAFVNTVLKYSRPFSGGTNIACELCAS